MKADLITLYPTICFDITKWKNGTRVRDGRAFSSFEFGTSHVFTYRKLKRDKSLLKPNYLRFIEEVHGKALDGAGKRLADFAIAFDTDVDVAGLDVPSPDSQQLLTYFAYQQGIDRSVDIDTVKIICFRGGGRSIHYNHRDEVSSWCPDIAYHLPVEQDHKERVKLHRHREEVLLDTLAEVQSSNPERYRKILTALALYNESCRASRYNANAAIVMIVSAFESLLQLPQWSKKDTFGYGLKALWSFDEKIEAWAIQLYELRSQIVHGEVAEGEILKVSN